MVPFHPDWGFHYLTIPSSTPRVYFVMFEIFVIFEFVA